MNKNQQYRASSKENNHNKNRTYTIVGLIFLLLVAVGIYLFYNSTYSYQSGKISASDNLIIDLPAISSQKGYFVLVDGNSHQLDHDQKTFATQVTPGKHRVIVSSDAYWPWNTNVTISDKKKVTLRPFLIQQNLADKVRVYRVLSEPDTYAEKNNLIKTETTDTSATSTDGSVSIAWNTSELRATWHGGGETPLFFCAADVSATTTCPNSKVVLNVQKPVFLDSAFYGNRSDVIIFAVPTGVYAIGIAGNSDTHNLEPIYKGNISEAIIKRDKVYIKDAKAKGNIIEITLPDVSFS